MFSDPFHSQGAWKSRTFPGRAIFSVQRSVSAQSFSFQQFNSFLPSVLLSPQNVFQSHSWFMYCPCVQVVFFAANSVSPTNFHNCLLVFFQFKTTSLSSASPFIRTRIEIWLVQNACKVWRNQSKLRHFDPANSLFDWRWISQTI